MIKPTDLIELLKRLIKESDERQDKKILEQAGKEAVIMPTKLKKRRTLYCNDEIWGRVIREAIKRKISVSQFVAEVLENYLGPRTSNVKE